VRAKLPAGRSSRPGTSKDALAQTPTPAEILVCSKARPSAQHPRREFPRPKDPGTDDPQVLDGITFDTFNEKQLIRLCVGLQTLQARKPWLQLPEHARRHHLKNAFFRLAFADYYLLEKTRYPRRTWPATSRRRPPPGRGDAARRIAAAVPRADQERETIIAEMDARDSSMFDVMDRIFRRLRPRHGR